MPLVTMARALARMADPGSLAGSRGEAAARIHECMTGHPEMVRGTVGFDTALMRAGQGRFATKTGAEGVHAGIVPALKLGIAVKVEDGAARASRIAMAAILDHLGLIDEGARVQLVDHMTAPVTNAAGKKVGALRIAAGWAD